jgi:hypothetical protein
MFEGPTPSPNEDQNRPEDPSHPSLGLSEEQVARLHASLALILSASLNLQDQGGRDHVAGLLQKALEIENLEALPKKPFHPDSLIAQMVIADLQQEGWQLHGPFETVMDILISPDKKQKLQFEHGGVPLNPGRKEPGTFFFVAQGEGAQEIWESRSAEKAAQLKEGQAEIQEMIERFAPSLTTALSDTPWHDADPETLRRVCSESPREIMLLAWNFKRDFTDQLML